MKKLWSRHIELVVVVSSLATFALVKLVWANKLAFLNLYYIPVLIAGYYLGRRPAIMSGLLSILLTTFLVISWPAEMLREAKGSLYLGLDLLIWASFLMLATILVTMMNENKRNRVTLATEDLLRKYLQRSLEGPDAHSIRVARIAGAIAKELRASHELVRQIEVAGLLHDLGQDREALEVLLHEGDRKADRQKSLVGAAVPIIIAGEEYQGEALSKLPQQSIGGKILAASNAYDELSSQADGRDCWQRLAELERRKVFDQQVLRALSRVVVKEGSEAPAPA